MAIAAASAISTCSSRCRPARTAPTPTRSAASRRPGRDHVHRPVADDVEAGLQPGLRARGHVVAYLRGRQVDVPGVVGVGG